MNSLSQSWFCDEVVYSGEIRIYLIVKLNGVSFEIIFRPVNKTSFKDAVTAVAWQNATLNMIGEDLERFSTRLTGKSLLGMSHMVIEVDHTSRTVADDLVTAIKDKTFRQNWFDEYIKETERHIANHQYCLEGTKFMKEYEDSAACNAAYDDGPFGVIRCTRDAGHRGSCHDEAFEQQMCEDLGVDYSSMCEE